MDLDKLIDWATINGCKISSSIEFKQISQNNYGAILKSKSEKPKITLSENLIITSKQSLNLFDKETYNNSSNKNSLLKFYLCHERTKSGTFFDIYFKSLPSLSQIDSPYTWSSQDKAYLKGTNLGSSLNENLATLVEEWWEVLNKLPESIPKPTNHYINMKFYYEYKFYKDDDYFEMFKNEDVDNWTSFTSYLWASLILKSRSFPSYLLSETFEKNECMLLPIIDLLNHDSKAKVDWRVENDGFEFTSNDELLQGDEIFNNYGLKGNEELLLAYGFAIENNSNDSIALKIKLPQEKVKEIESLGIKLPNLDDYTNSIIEKETYRQVESKKDYSDGLLFFINANGVPENLIQTFQALVKNQWEDTESITLRMKLSGLNHLRTALESKKELVQLSIPQDTTHHKYIKWYNESQHKLYNSSIKQIKQMENKILSESKSNLITLKSVYKKDVKFQQSLLFLGFPDYETILESEFQDQCWLLWLIRVYNKKPDDEVLPHWIQSLFKHLRNTYDITTQDVLNYRSIYENLVPDLQLQVPEIYNIGDWTLSEFIISGKLLDLISFVRGKEQECILVEQIYKI
ncbi:unnamed protein product [Candida verbasci]|uniref:SET domain-containing protein n=1 Tax=Candida verbasci TaxID=1227364 RepID=A0A9W4XJQ1_9ASCO|nr:unnamed protein product [Candida verbasci]